MNRRNDSLYVRPSNMDFHPPGSKTDFEEEQTKLISEISVLNGL